MPNPRKGREGSRWYNERPSPAKFAEWFKTVPMHDGLKPEDYIGGVVLIPSKEKAKEVRGFNESSGMPIIGDVENLVYSPYPAVATRLRYFQDYLALHPEWVGVMEVDRAPAELGLPDGYFRYAAAGPDGKAVNYIGYSSRVRILIRDTVNYVDVREGKFGEMTTTRRLEGVPVFEGTPGTKIVPVANRWGVDENAPMKAQSGANGRALGNAGMLIIPGSTIATAEDMTEALSGDTGVAAELPAPSAVRAATAVETPAQRIKTLKEDLGKLDADAVAGFEEWARDRKLKMSDAGDVNTAIKRLEGLIDQFSRA